MKILSLKILRIFLEKVHIFDPLFQFFSFRKCRVVAEIHNSYVFNTFNEYQREVLPKELCCYKSQFTYLMFLFSPFSEQQHRPAPPASAILYFPPYSFNGFSFHFVAATVATRVNVIVFLSLFLSIVEK